MDAKMEERFAAMEAKMETQRKTDNAEMETKRKADIAELENKIAAVKLAKTSKGTVTQAQFYQTIKKDDQLKTEIDESNVWSPKNLPEWPLKNWPEEPEDGAKENPRVQSIVSAILEALKLEVKDDAGFKSLPDPDAYKTASFRSRKPDIVNYMRDKEGSLAISSFGDCKRRATGNFTDQEKGHILDMARSFMEHVGFYFPFLVVFLTDGKRWQFFRVSRAESNLVYREGILINNNLEGWRRYLALLTADLQDIGANQLSLKNQPNYRLQKPLGRGGSAVVYQAESLITGEAFLVKVYHAEKAKSFEAEKRALRKLKEYEGVPKLEAIAAADLKVDGSLLGNVIIASPVGVHIAPPHGDGVLVYGKHLHQLVKIVENAHLLGLLHRDIKPDNVYLNNDDQSMLLNDWSSSCLKEEEEERNGWEGTVGFSVHTDEPLFTELDGEARDLVGVVRTSYSLLFRQIPPSDSTYKVFQYWSERLSDETHWGEALQLAKGKNYDDLAELLRKMK